MLYLVFYILITNFKVETTLNNSSEDRLNNTSWTQQQKFPKLCATVFKTYGESLKKPRQKFQKITAQVWKSHGTIFKTPWQKFGEATPRQKFEKATAKVSKHHGTSL